MCRVPDAPSGLKVASAAVVAPPTSRSGCRFVASLHSCGGLTLDGTGSHPERTFPRPCAGPRLEDHLRAGGPGREAIEVGDRTVGLCLNLLIQSSKRGRRASAGSRKATSRPRGRGTDFRRGLLRRYLATSPGQVDDLRFPFPGIRPAYGRPYVLGRPPGVPAGPYRAGAAELSRIPGRRPVSAVTSGLIVGRGAGVHRLLRSGQGLFRPDRSLRPKAGPSANPAPMRERPPRSARCAVTPVTR